MPELRSSEQQMSLTSATSQTGKGLSAMRPVEIMAKTCRESLGCFSCFKISSNFFSESKLQPTTSEQAHYPETFFSV